MLNCVAFNRDLAGNRAQPPRGGLNRFPGVAEIAVAGCASPGESMPSGSLAWRHGFQLRRLRLSPGSEVPTHTRQEEEVIFVHEGEMEVAVDGERTRLLKGDLLTTPCGISRSFRNPGGLPLDAVVVRGSDHPAKARFA